MAGRVLIRDEAIHDLDQQAAYIGKDNPDAAIRFLDAAHQTFSFIAENPHLGAACNFLNPRASGVRLRTVPGFRHYVVFYRPLEQGVEVLRVLHAAQNFAAWFESNMN